MPGGPPLPARRTTALALALLAAACHRGGEHGPPQRPAVPVVLGETEQRDVPQTIGAVGSVQPFVTVSVRPLVTGEIVKVLFRDGDEVQRGQQLFEIDPRPYQAALQQARANLVHQREQAANARADARRYADLVKKEYVTQQQYQAALTNAASLQADAAGAEAAVRKAELDLENCRVDSPITGRTGAVLVQIGNVVQANQANPLVVVAQMKPISIAFTVPEGNVGALRQGIDQMKVTAQSPQGPPRDGTLAFLNNTADPATGTVLAKATFPNEDEALWPGQFVNVRILLGVQRGVVVAPTPAIVTGQSGSYVFVVKDDMTVEQRPVKVARSDASQAVIAQGLAPGERVVVDGQLGLQPGVRVVPKPPVQQRPQDQPQAAPAQQGHGEEARAERPTPQQADPVPSEAQPGAGPRQAPPQPPDRRQGRPPPGGAQRPGTVQSGRDGRDVEGPARSEAGKP